MAKPAASAAIAAMCRHRHCLCAMRNSSSDRMPKYGSYFTRRRSRHGERARCREIRGRLGGGCQWPAIGSSNGPAGQPRSVGQRTDRGTADDDGAITRSASRRRCAAGKASEQSARAQTRLGACVFVRSARMSTWQTISQQVGNLELRGRTDAATLPMVVDDTGNLLLGRCRAHRQLFPLVLAGRELSQCTRQDRTRSGDVRRAAPRRLLGRLRAVIRHQLPDAVLLLEASVQMTVLAWCCP